MPLPMIKEYAATRFEKGSEVVGEKVGKFVLTMTLGIVKIVVGTMFSVYFGLGNFKRGFKKGFNTKKSLVP